MASNKLKTNNDVTTIELYTQCLEKKVGTCLPTGKRSGDNKFHSLVEVSLNPVTTALLPDSSVSEGTVLKRYPEGTMLERHPVILNFNTKQA